MRQPIELEVGWRARWALCRWSGRAVWNKQPPRSANGAPEVFRVTSLKPRGGTARRGDVPQDLLRSRQRLLLLVLQPLRHLVGKPVQQFEEGSIGPAEPNHVHWITEFDVRFRGAGHHVVLFANVAVAAKILRHHGKKFIRNPVSIMVEAVAPQALDRQRFNVAPSVW